MIGLMRVTYVHVRMFLSCRLETEERKEKSINSGIYFFSKELSFLLFKELYVQVSSSIQFDPHPLVWPLVPLFELSDSYFESM